MKIRFLLVAGVLFFLSVFSSCYHHHHHDVSISIRESEREYQLSASFDESRTRQVQNYIDEYTGSNGIFRSGNVEIDATTTLEDNIRVYIKSHPGHLKIKFDKADNDEASYEKVKDMCEGIKELLAKN